MLWWSHRRQCTTGCHQIVDGRTNQLSNLRISEQSAASTLRKIDDNDVGDNCCGAGYVAGTR